QPPEPAPDLAGSSREGIALAFGGDPLILGLGERGLGRVARSVEVLQAPQASVQHGDRIGGNLRAERSAELGLRQVELLVQRGQVLLDPGSLALGLSGLALGPVPIPPRAPPGLARLLGASPPLPLPSLS